MIATVVTWTSGDGADIALSFENDLGCHDFWYIFLSLSSSNRDRVEMCKFLDRSPDFIPSDEEERANHSQMIPEPSAPRSRPSISLSLPEKVEIETIPDIDHILEKALDASAETRRGICTAILEASHISKLLDLFRVAEDLQSRPTLYRLYSIFKNLLNFNNNAILEELFSEKNIFNVAGVFEYDPAYPETRSDYRQYLTDRNRFKQILDFSDNPYLLRSIHQTFRLQFLKDVVLPRILSEETFNSLLFMVRCNFVEIIDSLDQDPQFLSKLEPLFLSEEETECESTLKFMKEFLSIAKSSADDRNLRIYQGESFKTSLGFLQRMLSGTSLPCQILATDILITISQYDSNMIKQLMLESKSMPMEQQLLVAMIDRFGDASTKIGLRWQLVAILRTLLGSSWAVGLPASNDEFLNSFYPDYALRLLNPLVELDKRLSSSDKETPLLFSQQEADLYFNCCELLCSFIIQHKYRIKYLLFRSFIIHNMLLLLNCQNKYLRLCPIRVIRTMVGTGDDFYFRFFIKQTIFKPLLEEAIALAAADNALTSALSELFIFIKEVLPSSSLLVFIFLTILSWIEKV